MFNGFIAGVLGACVAIGGGLVLIPLWLKAGIDKDIVTSSTAPLIFFSSSISFIISALLGQYDSIFLIILFFALSFTSSYVIKSKNKNIQMLQYTLCKNINLKNFSSSCYFLLWPFPYQSSYPYNTKNIKKIKNNLCNLIYFVDLLNTN